MCCTLGKATLSETVLLGAQVVRNGAVLQVIGYQNRVANASPRPNAMILPFPAAVPMGPENIIDTRAFPRILQDYRKVVPLLRSAPQTKPTALSAAAGGMPRVQVFDSGTYTVVLADRPSAIPAALERVPEKKRPPANQEIMDAYEALYPGWPVALCCFDGAIEPEPLLWWFAPLNPEMIWLPAVDAHTGHAPVRGRVDVDHDVVIAGNWRDEAFDTVLFADSIPLPIKPYLPRRAFGRRFVGSMDNGDFVIPLESAARAATREIVRRFPDGSGRV